MNYSNEIERTATLGETLLALGPLLLFPVLFLLGIILTPFINNLNVPDLGLVVIFAVIGALLIVLGVGWVKKFPRWSFPYWGLALQTFWRESFSFQGGDESPVSLIKQSSFM